MQSGARGDRVKHEKGALGKESDARASVAPTKNPSKIEGVKVNFGNKMLIRGRQQVFLLCVLSIFLSKQRDDSTAFYKFLTNLCNAVFSKINY